MTAHYYGDDGTTWQQHRNLWVLMTCISAAVTAAGATQRYWPLAVFFGFWCGTCFTFAVFFQWVLPHD